MLVKINGMEAFNVLATAAPEAIKPIEIPSVVATAVPNINIDHMADTLIELGQIILLGTSGVVVVVCGILIAVGLKREGWKKVIAVIQGLGVGLVGPTIVTIVAGLFAGFAQMIV